VSEWSPAQYDRFKDERSRPFRDLLALCERPAARCVDLGCGTGELTAELHRAMRATTTLGVDSSPEMLAKAPTLPGLSFERRRIEDLAPPGPYDLVFSNAALQWVDDHEALLPRIASWVSPDGGQLAVQMPANDAHPSHVVAAEVASEEPFRSALGGWARVFPNLAPERYARLLDDLGFARQHVSLRVYAHHLASRDDVAEWVKGTLLTAYRERLPAELRPAYEARYREALRARLPDERPFFFPFRRILFWARR
jgi:trans-aconitate 2-methyltransferase